MRATPHDRTLWTTDNDPGNVLATALGALLLGLAIALTGWALRGAPGEEGWVALGMLVTGVLMVLGGGGMLLAFPRETITVDPERQRLVIATRTRFSEHMRTIRFSQIETLRVGRSGDSEGGTETFHVSAQLIDGSTCALFANHYAGTKDQHVAEERRQRLGRMVLAAHPSKAASLLPPPPRGWIDRLLNR